MVERKYLRKGIVAFIVCILLFSIFTVETNQDIRASFKERCPTCIDTHTVFIPLDRIDPSYLIDSVEQYVDLGEEEQLLSLRDLTNHFDRAPPISSPQFSHNPAYTS